jgi:riboflavin synthase
MFTGIIEEVGSVASIESGAAGNARLTIAANHVLESATKEGDSICVNGVCLTAVNLTPTTFSADLAPETMRRTNLGDLAPGSLVNLERALLPTTRLSGHIVQGHIDATGEIAALDLLGEDNWWLKVKVPAELDRYLVFKGSVALDGISLTVASLEGGILGITIIPHTIEHTALKSAKPGQRINIETDILARHVEKFLLVASPPVA